jgi:hypothetical protein
MLRSHVPEIQIRHSALTRAERSLSQSLLDEEAFTCLGCFSLCLPGSPAQICGRDFIN